MNDWLAELHERLLAGKSCVRVVVANVIGSAPREIGATMLVSDERTDGTIGGGHLEWKAIESARTMLAQAHSTQSHSTQPIIIERLLLGAMLGQCCGGAVELWLERYDVVATDIVASLLAQRGKDLLLITTQGSTPKRRLIDRNDLAAHNLSLPKNFDSIGTALLRSKQEAPILIERIDLLRRELWLFGAGHVGKALVKILADLPLRIIWVDSRATMFAPSPLAPRLPHNVIPLCTEYPLDVVSKAPPAAWFLVMTHSHDLDYEICRAVLTRDDFAWLGLIGSHTKATNFRNRLRRDDVDRDAIVRMTCPIGLPSVSSKLPTAIAVSVAAQLIGLFEECNFTAIYDQDFTQAQKRKNPADNAMEGISSENSINRLQAQTLQHNLPPGPYA